MMIQANGIIDLLGVWIGFGLTICILSYVFGDNLFFRLATNTFIGVTAGFATISIIYNVLLPQLILPLFDESNPNRTLLIIPLVLCSLIFLKISKPLSRMANPVIAMLVGVGAATIVGGAIRGTIFPQLSVLVNSLNLAGVNVGISSLLKHLFEGGFILLGTLSTLIYFHFGTRQKLGQPPRRNMIVEWIFPVGKLFILIALGFLFTGVLLASLAAFVDRIQYIWKLVETII
jgi:hypothetical protein